MLVVSLQSKMLKIIILTLSVLGWLPNYTVADTPANCTYEDVEGTWIFYESERNQDNTINCDGKGCINNSFNFENCNWCNL